MTKPRREVKLSGSLTVAACEIVQAEIGAALEQSDNVALVVDPDAEVDLTFLQILIAAQQTAIVRNKRLTLAGAPAGAFARALEVCGYTPTGKTLTQIFTPQRQGSP